MSLYERTATNDDNRDLSAEERTLFDFYSSPLDKNGIRVSLDKVSTPLNTTTILHLRR